LQSGPSFVTIL